MFGMGPVEIMVILLIGFVLLGPERMIDAAKLIGKASKEVRRMTDELPRLTLDDEIGPISDKAGPGSGPVTTSGPSGSSNVDAGADAGPDSTPVDFKQGEAPSKPVASDDVTRPKKAGGED